MNISIFEHKSIKKVVIIILISKLKIYNHLNLKMSTTVIDSLVKYEVAMLVGSSMAKASKKAKPV